MPASKSKKLVARSKKKRASRPARSLVGVAQPPAAAPSATICALCRKPAALVDSHVLPELLYKPSYDNSHRAIIVHVEDEWKGSIRKGLREKLLCTPCEAKLSVYESYFSHIWFRSSSRLRPATLTTQITRCSGLDYKKFKLFCLSLLWRASVSKLPQFADADLGETHADRMRLMLLKADAGGDQEYRFWAAGLVEDGTNAFVDGVIKCPQRAKIEGHSFYFAIFGGCGWYFAVSPNATTVLPAGSCLTPAGTLDLFRQPFTTFRPITSVAQQFRNATSHRQPPRRP